MKYFSTLFIFSLFISVGCSYSSNKNIKLNNFNRQDRYASIYIPDSILVVFFTGFENDKITIMNNNSVIINDTISTNYSIGIARFYTLKKDKYSIAINNEKIINNINLKRKYNGLEICYLYDTLTYKFVDSISFNGME